MMVSKITNCTICGNEKTRPLKGYEKDFLVSCVKCTFVFSEVRPTDEELKKAYGGYSRDVAPTAGTLHKIRNIATHLKTLSNAKKVLDIGCGEGAFLVAFKELGCDVYGTEFDERTVNICRGKGINMLPGGVMPGEEKNENVGKFDVVVFTEVIEHINNPLDVIANISRLLKPNGLLYITTPNFSSLERFIIGPNWGLIAYPEHISYYSPRTLNFLLRRSGFEKVALRTENLSVFRIIQYLNRRFFQSAANKQLDPEQTAATAQQAVQSSGILRIAKNLVNAALGISGSGTSLVAIYRKSGNKGTSCFN